MVIEKVPNMHPLYLLNVQSLHSCCHMLGQLCSYSLQHNLTSLCLWYADVDLLLNLKHRAHKNNCQLLLTILPMWTYIELCNLSNIAKVTAGLLELLTYVFFSYLFITKDKRHTGCWVRQGSKTCSNHQVWIAKSLMVNSLAGTSSMKRVHTFLYVLIWVSYIYL